MGMFKPIVGNTSTVVTITPLCGQGWQPGQSWSGHCPSRADPCPLPLLSQATHLGKASNQ